ncbi:hypothetical protein A5740_27315 [Mycobacterium sp. GA-1841]|nr:hypothetical protein A5740_27315 [Mycobacterium sp. GA-1841]
MSALVHAIPIAIERTGRAVVLIGGWQSYADSAVRTGPQQTSTRWTVGGVTTRRNLICCSAAERSGRDPQEL